MRLTGFWLEAAEFRYVPRDLWLGVYVGSPIGSGVHQTRTLYVCFVPMFPLCLTFSYTLKPSRLK